MKNIDVIGGGTIAHIRCHLGLVAPAFGATAKQLFGLLDKYDNYRKCLYLTKMADSNSSLETNEDVSCLLDKLIENPDTKLIFFNPALVDYEASVAISGAMGTEWGDLPTISGKYEPRLKTSEGEQKLLLTPAPKLISKIRKDRKDIFLVGFKTTCGLSENEQFLSGLHLLKSSSCNLVLANDVKTRVNMIITPEQARYTVTVDRELALSDLVKMAIARSQSTFTRSEIVEGVPVPWSDESVPEALRKVVNHCIKNGAYKPFEGKTVGHFAVKLDNKTFLTSRRNTNFNNLDKVGLVEVESTGLNNVVAYGSKPSVGGQSQRIIFSEHPEMDCIVHMHIKHKPNAILSHRSQKGVECGSHECGKNTSNGLREEVPGIKCVFLDKHGPNIVFNKSIDPNKVIKFIDDNFDFDKSTDDLRG